LMHANFINICTVLIELKFYTKYINLMMLLAWY